MLFFLQKIATASNVFTQCLEKLLHNSIKIMKQYLVCKETTKDEECEKCATLM